MFFLKKTCGEVGLVNEGVVVVMRLVSGEEENCVCQKIVEPYNGLPNKTSFDFKGVLSCQS